MTLLASDGNIAPSSSFTSRLSMEELASTGAGGGICSPAPYGDDERKFFCKDDGDCGLCVNVGCAAKLTDRFGAGDIQEDRSPSPASR